MGPRGAQGPGATSQFPRAAWDAQVRRSTAEVRRSTAEVRRSTAEIRRSTAEVRRSIAEIHDSIAETHDSMDALVKIFLVFKLWGPRGAR